MVKKNKPAGKKNTSVATEDELAGVITSALNSKFKDQGNVVFTLNDAENPSNIGAWVSTGNAILDLFISNTPHGGIACGRLTEIAGLESCVTEDTEIDVVMGTIAETIQIKEIKKLLSEGRKVSVKTLNGEYTGITNYIQKGILDTYLVTLENGFSIKTSKTHLFFTDTGWCETGKLIPKSSKILCDVGIGTYIMVKSVDLIGKCNIVDITVEHPEACYYGNKMLNHNSGKSLLAAHIIANTQKAGGLAVYIENEASLHKAFLTACGVDVDKMLYVNLDTVEDIFTAIENIVIKVREKQADRLVTIVVDSIGAASSKVEMESTYDKAGYNTTKAIVISQGLRKLMPLIAKQKIAFICINQLREKVGVIMTPFSDRFVTPGGKAIGFHATTRLRVSVSSKIKMKINSVDEIVGTNVKAKIIKSKLGPSARDCEYECFFNSGIQPYSNWIDYLVKYGKCTRSGKTYEIIDTATGEVHKYDSKTWLEVLANNEAIRECVYGLLCGVIIMDYQAIGVNTDNIFIEDIDGVDEI